MPTRLEKKVTRVGTRPASKARGRLLVVSLLPGDLISIREFKKRKAYTGTLESVYYFLAKQEAERTRQQRAEARKAKKKGG